MPTHWGQHSNVGAVDVVVAAKTVSIPHLVEAFGLASSTLNRRTTTLLKNGLVERTVDPSGSIAHKFRITEEGLGRLAAERERTASGLAEPLSGWTPERMDRFIGDLEQFNTDIERMTGRSHARRRGPGRCPTWRARAGAACRPGFSLRPTL
ncbi:MarR family winged helix-turn-helix transcriptional regulator [Streptomyces tibetensis]|uniref:MarR family winged helix-turn-helix transcriptional regulator n=1 Tax=Streptomyces tibetensis TaxID=2382123 RepID=UPI0033F624D3